MNEIKLNGKLVDAEGLLNELFSDGCRPGLRWLRTQTAAKTIPHVRIGHLVFFDVEMVRCGSLSNGAHSRVCFRRVWSRSRANVGMGKAAKRA